MKEYYNMLPEVLGPVARSVPGNRYVAQSETYFPSSPGRHGIRPPWQLDRTGISGLYDS